MSLISGLYDEETKQAVLSKVDEMPLAEKKFYTMKKNRKIPNNETY